MSEEKERNEVSEAKLEEVSGGVSYNIATYVCPVCGHKELVRYVGECDLNYSHWCLPCDWVRKERVEMVRQ